jgi:hypothetical protein
MTRRVIEARHGFPGALRAAGGVGGHVLAQYATAPVLGTVATA